MAIKKSELYSSLWAGCDELRGGMDASQYKDYVLVLLFVKYISDKNAGDPDALIEIPEGGSFRDMVALKGKKEIGDGINKIIGKLAKINEDLKGVIDAVDFNDEDKLGKGKEMTDRLTHLIAIFENPALNFSKNRADNDDILGDAYEYLMKNFAKDSGKSKGQFYTPSEVSRIIAKVIGIRDIETGKTIYDPTCGSGSLLLKSVAETDDKVTVTIYGQEKDVATAALARMNMIIHGNETAEIQRGQSTLSDPLFKDKHGYLKTFDFVVANPPFSSKNWMNGFDPANDIFERFKGYGVPPAKNGDYAFLLHIVKSLKSKGKGACILPHGVLFRGNVEAAIRKNLIQKGYIKGIIGLPANLFFGTGIPACIVVADKENAASREGIFMVDAGKGFIKDGNKNRLREQDIHKITDVFNKQTEIPGFSRMVPLSEISDPKNAYNLNIPRYIDSQETEDIQDIEAHLTGGIPNADIDALEKYWEVYPALKTGLFENCESEMMNQELNNKKRPNYSRLSVHHSQLKEKIFSHPEFTAFSTEMDTLFDTWKSRNTKLLKALEKGLKPKEIIFRISEDLLSAYTGKKLIEKYDVYQHLMDFWNETMQDDCYLISAEGWKAEPYRITVENKAGKKVDKGWACDLVPGELMLERFFQAEKQHIGNLEAEKESISAQMEEMKEEHSGEDGLLEEVKNDKGNITKALVLKRQKEIKDDTDAAEERKVLKAYAKLINKEAETIKQIRIAVNELDTKVLERYAPLTEDEIKTLVADDKWMASIEKAVKSEMERISQRLTQRIKELAERYETPLPQHNKTVGDLEEKVKGHLEKMGFLWN